MASHGVEEKMAGEKRDLLSELPHVIVLALLLVVLLFVVTKFKWVHCSQIPQWCNIYCTATGSSRVAIVTGENDPGIGSGDQLERLLNQNRIHTLVTRLSTSDLSTGLLEDYELVVLTQAKNISLRQALSIKAYLDKGGSLLWEGDALGNNYTITDEDKFLLEAENQSRPGTYEAYLRLLNRSSGYGFGFLGEVLGIRYVATRQTDSYFNGTVRFRSVKDHLVTSGIKNFELLYPVAFAQVIEDSRAVTKIAVIGSPGREVPMLLERKFGGRVMYSAIPIEYIDSKTLLLNIFDYLVTC